MKNFVQPGNALNLPAPYDRLAGEGALVGSIFGVAVKDVLSTVVGAFETEGVFDLAKLNTQVWVAGDPIHWSIANKRTENVPTVGPMIGYATEAAANPTLTGKVKLLGLPGNGAVVGVEQGSSAATVITTAGAATYTIAQLLTGLIERDPNGGARTDVLPTAALLVAGIPGCKVGDLVKCAVANCADAAEAITIAVGTGGAYGTQPAGAQTIPQNITREVWIRVTNVTAASEAYTVALI
jgi:predicted RecA/RadA family phage recombinase